MLSFLFTGGSCIYLSSIGSPPNAIAAKVSMIRLIHKIWTMEKGSVQPSTGAIMFISKVAIFIVSWKIRNFPTDFAIVLLLSTQSFMEVKLLLSITTSPASCATAVPSPMANPISACFSAGASLTPSPVIPQTLSMSCERDTSLFLSRGLALLTTRRCGSTSLSFSSDIASSSSCVRTTSFSSSLSIPASFAIATAVSSASPVTITTCIPASLSISTVSMASALTLSLKQRTDISMVLPSNIFTIERSFIVLFACASICSSTFFLFSAVNSLSSPFGST